MSAIIANPSTITSCGDGQINPISFNSPAPCKHCGANLPTNNPEHAVIEPVCQSCGRQESDVIGFYIYEKRTNFTASPMFASFEQARQFADFFGMSLGDQYGVYEFVSFFTSALRDGTRQNFLNLLEESSRLLTKLLSLPAESRTPAELPYVACGARLLGYALPQFQEGYGEEEIA